MSSSATNPPESTAHKTDLADLKRKSVRARNEAVENFAFFASLR
jgi:hypothetical protein